MSNSQTLSQDQPDQSRTAPSAATTTPERVRRRRRHTPSTPRSRLANVALLLAGCAGSLVLAFIGFNIYVQVAEGLNPSGRVFVEVDGQKVYLEQPTAVVTPPVGASGAAPAADPTNTDTATDEAAPADATAPPDPATIESGGAAGEKQQAARSTVPLPPVHLEIPAIDVDVSVMLADNDNLPRHKFAGWFFKSAFPATAGNMVLLGHLDGNAAIFGRLNELQPGDEIRVSTQDSIHVYVIDESWTVDDTEVSVLAPTSDPVVTLITCAGDWNPYEHSYNKRLVVRGHYAAVEPLSDGAGS